MDNIELEQKILDIIKIENYFDMVIAAKDFEKEYKMTEFYKITKKSLNEVIKEAKIYYAMQLKDFGTYIQNIINNLDLNNLYSLLDQVAEVFGNENQNIQENLEVLKEFSK